MHGRGGLTGGARKITHTDRMSGIRHVLPNELGPSFTSAEAAQKGVNQRRLRQPDVLRVHRGLYRRRDPDDSVSTTSHQARRAEIIDRVRALRGRIGPGRFVARATAAILWRLPFPAPVPTQIAIDCLAPGRTSRLPEVDSRQVQPHLVTITEFDGLPVSDPASTWARLGTELTLRDLVAMGDAIIHEHRMPGTDRILSSPLAELSDLADAAASRRRPGAERLRLALPLLSSRAASAPESHLRLAIRGWGFPDPVLDHDVFDDSGRLLGCSELAYPRVRLALEYEGEQHLTDRSQWNRDIAKYRDYGAAGWEVLRVTPELLYGSPQRLRAQLGEALVRRSAIPPR